MKKITSTIAALILLLGVACVPDDDEFCTDPTDRSCPNFEPCLVAVKADSDFEFVVSYSSLLTSDTIIDLPHTEAYGGSNVKYVASVGGQTSYEWKVGSDPRTFNGPELFLRFNNFALNIPVTLKTTVIDSNMCFEANMLSSESTRNFKYHPVTRPEAILGTFKGKILNRERDYEVTVGEKRFAYKRLFGNLPFPADCNFKGRGIPLTTSYQTFVSTFNQETGTPRCRNLIVIGRINHEDNDLLRIEYFYDNDLGGRDTLIFEGRRQ